MSSSYVDSSDEDEREKIRRSKRWRRYGFSDDDEDVMIFRRKRRNFDGEEEEGDGVDRISNLSDELLHKIMSFMNTKFAVQTCVLSKRWKLLWKSLPCLDFNIETFPFQQIVAIEEEKDEDNDDYGDEDEEEDEDSDDHGDEDEEEDEDNDDHGDVDEGFKRKMLSFGNFIKQVLFRRIATRLVKVYIRCYTYKQYGFSLDWLLCYAVEHNVQQLTIISYSSSYPLLLPQTLFNCKSLVSLTLKDYDSFGNSLKLPKFIALPALKSLHVEGFGIMEENFDASLFSGCPNLESLKLLVEQPKDSICINAYNLKFLELALCSFTVENFICKVVFDTPRLTTFKYKSHIPLECKANNLASLNDVYIDTSPCQSEFEIKKEEYALLLIDTFKELRHAKSLTLSWETFEVFVKSPSLLEVNQSPFVDLKCLKLECPPCGFELPGSVLNYFLNNSTMFKIC